MLDTDHNYVSYYTLLFKRCRQVWGLNANPQHKITLDLNMKKNSGSVKCEKCKCNLNLKTTKFEKDHIEPLGGSLCLSEKMFYEKLDKLQTSKIQILCKICHCEKSKRDRIAEKTHHIPDFIPRIVLAARALGISNADIPNLKRYLTWNSIKKFERSASSYLKLKNEKQPSKLKTVERKKAEVLLMFSKFFTRRKK